jgi:hypothetical protein
MDWEFFTGDDNVRRQKAPQAFSLTRLRGRQASSLAVKLDMTERRFRVNYEL